MRRKAAALVEAEGRKAILVEGDLRSADHCRKVVDRAVHDLGGVDILVNNAAHQATFKDLADISDEEWRMTFDVNIHAMFFLAKAAVPHMQPGGAIINTASVSSGHAQSHAAGLCDDEGRYSEFHRRVGPDAGGERHPRERRGARADLDAADPVDHARRRRQELRQAGADEARRAAGRAGDGVRDAG